MQTTHRNLMATTALCVLALARAAQGQVEVLNEDLEITASGTFKLGTAVAISGTVGIAGSSYGAYLFDVTTGELLHDLDLNPSVNPVMGGPFVAIDGNIALYGDRTGGGCEDPCAPA